MNFAEKAMELVEQMTIEEAASQLRYDSPAVKRLGVPAYTWWNEALHGVARAGTATVFPQAIGLAAMFDGEFLEEIADAVATEGRAKFNMFRAQGDSDIYKGINFWSPNINIFRDPRWGRGHETYGEDPYLTSRLAVAYIRGLQGTDGTYLKAAACAKHFVAYSGPEDLRHGFNAIVSPKDMEETYLPAFEAAVKEAQVEVVMGAYNRTNGEPCCGSKTLLVDLLRNKWKFQGHVASDCWAIKDFHENHMVTGTAEESAALALNNGCDVNCGNIYLYLLSALKKKLTTEEAIRLSASRLFTTRYKLGMFDKKCSFNDISYEENDCKKHKELNLKAGRKSIILLKNEGILPLEKGKLTTIGVIGPTANSKAVLEGNYCGLASRYTTNIEGIYQALEEEKCRILYSEGCHLSKDRVEALSQANDRISEAKAVAARSDVVILCLGLDSSLEGEQQDTGNRVSGGDKSDMQLPMPQRILLEQMIQVGKPIVLVVNAGSALDLRTAASKCAAILQCWYSGARGGEALADILFGKVSPCGKLPITIYDGEEFPDMTDYSMKGRTYRYLLKKALYPFGFGLSYTDFVFTDFKLDYERVQVGEEITGTVNVANQGSFNGECVVQMYLRYEDIRKNQPNFSLCFFNCASIHRGEAKKIFFTIKPHELTIVTEDGMRIAPKGKFTLFIGDMQPDERSYELTGKNCLETEIVVQ